MAAFRLTRKQFCVCYGDGGDFYSAVARITRMQGHFQSFFTPTDGCQPVACHPVFQYQAALDCGGPSLIKALVVIHRAASIGMTCNDKSVLC